MTPKEVLIQLADLREAYRKQSFSYTKDQKIQFEKLRKLRYERVKYMNDNGLVYRGGTKKEVASK